MNFKTIRPVIKWSGSKRSQAYSLLTFFPKDIDTYYEPFIGGGSVLRALLNNKNDFKINHYVCCDNDANLINLWNTIKENPELVYQHYKELWDELNKDGDKARKRDFFTLIRKRLNEEHNPLDFMFIMRTTTNGMPRYNNDGEFNNSFHITRDGINPETLKEIIFDWSQILNENNVEFRNCSYSTIEPKENDFCYLDPPYANTKGMYGGNFNQDEFFEWLSKLKCHYAWSYNGMSGKEDNTFDVPKELYNQHLYLKSGNSSFKRTIGKDKNAMVMESLYLK